MRISDWSSDVCSSDLVGIDYDSVLFGVASREIILGVFGSTVYRKLILLRQRIPVKQVRSEEHTSELQSLMRISYAVFCLKKKTNVNLVTTDHLVVQLSINSIPNLNNTLEII